MSGIYGRFCRAADQFADATAVEVMSRDGLESWTYRDLRVRADTLACSLASEGLEQGDRCALLAENGAHWCAAYLGMQRLGVIPVPLDTSYTPTQIARLMTDSGARMIVASPRFRDEAEQARKESACPSFVLQDAGPGENGEVIDSPPATVGLDDVGVILYTSGTTSDPKGVVLTHGNLLAEIDSALSVVTLHPSDKILGVLPLFHALAQMANLLMPLTIGARVVFLDTVSSSELMRALHEREISVFCCVPQFFYLIHQRVLDQVSRSSRLRRLAFSILLATSGFLRERLRINIGSKVFARVHHALGPHMRLLVTGGSRFDPRIGRDLFRLGFNILQAYGLTETSGGASVLRPGDRHVDSVGQALPGVEVKIVPSEVTGGAGEHPARARGNVGEVVIRGPVVSPGYFRREDVNAVAFRDGWLHTGDLGYLDAAGRLYVTGRAKEVIVLGSGKNIYPEEIEAHYAQSPFIKELCVMGRQLPDAPVSERLHAVIVPDFDVLRERKIFNSRDILRFEVETLSAKLPGHKRIMSYDVLTDDLPRTTTRKLKRFEIERGTSRSQEADPPTPAPSEEVDSDADWASDPEVAGVLAILRQETHFSGPIRRPANLELDMGLDSMGRVELLAAVEARLGISLPEEVSHGIHTVGELVAAVRRDGGSGPGPIRAVDFDPWRNLLDDVSNDDPAVAPVLDSRPVLDVVLFIVSRIVFVGAWILLGLRVSGREQLPRKGPFLISPNHQSFLDAFLLASVLPFRVFRNTFYVGATEYFETPLRAAIARMIRVVPVDPDANLVLAMRAGALGLRHGKILILFPEGERSIDADIKTFKKGAAILSMKVGAPIVPVALDGLFDIWPRARRPRLLKLLPFSGTRTRIRFGAPLEAGPEEQHADDVYASYTSRLRAAVGEMLGALRRRDV